VTIFETREFILNVTNKILLAQYEYSYSYSYVLVIKILVRRSTNNANCSFRHL